MARIIEIDGEYYVEYYAQGLKFFKKGGVDKHHAQILLNEICETVGDPRKLYDVRKDKIFDFFEDVFVFLQQNYSDKSFQRFKKSGTHFLSFLSEQHEAVTYVADITPFIIESYKIGLLKLKSLEGLKSIDINLAMILLTEIFQYAIKVGALTLNPFSFVKIIQDKNCVVPDFFKECDVNCLLEKTSEDMSFSVQFFIATGLGLEDVKTLTWENVHFKKKCILLRTSDLSGECFREVFLEEMFLRILEKKLQNIKNLKQSLLLDLHGFEQSLNELGVEFSTLRNTCIYHMLVNKKMSLFDVYRYLNYEDIIDVYKYHMFVLDKYS